jgi:hypothetical protein
VAIAYTVFGVFFAAHRSLRRSCRSGRLTSPERLIHAHAGERIAFWCRGALLWPIYVAALIKPDLGVTLARAPA